MSFTPATIKVGESGTAQNVQFNPASLRVTTTNQLDDDHPNQVSKPTGFKLDVELLFDSTHDGSDIFQKTRAIRDAATATAQGATAPAGGAGGSSASSRSGTAASGLSLVTFSWGTTHYRGYIESLNETLDYWSSDGVPLRSTLQISIKGTTENFLTGTYGTVARYTENPAPRALEIVATDAASDQARFTRTAAAGGDGSTGRGLAGLNGVENMRGGTSAFAGASAGAFAGASAGAGASASAGASAGASASAGAFAGAGASASAGAGVSAGAGAQLQAAAAFRLAGGVSAGASLGFGAGASAGLSAGAGLGASVGVGMAAGAGIGMGGGIGLSAGAGIGMSGGIGIGGSAGVGLGMSAGLNVGLGGGGIGISTSTSVTGFDGVTHSSSTTSVTGFDGVTRTTSSSSVGSGSTGIPATAGAFAALGASRTTLPGAGFDPDRLLPPPLPGGGASTNYDVSGRAVSGDGQVAASYSAHAGVTVW